jgi:hypothetical protein
MDSLIKLQPKDADKRMIEDYKERAEKDLTLFIREQSIIRRNAFKNFSEMLFYKQKQPHKIGKNNE